jgi:hypothetical protein
MTYEETLIAEIAADYQAKRAKHKDLKDELVTLVRKTLNSSTPFVSCWEFCPYGGNEIGPEEAYKRMREIIYLLED